MASEQAQGEAILSGGNERGLYTLTTSDLKIIDAIETTRFEYEMSLDNLGSLERMDKLASIVNSMKIFMRSYNFEGYLSSHQIDGFTFSDVENNLNETDGDIEFIHKACDISFTVWKNVLRKLGVGLPTYRENVKKKILQNVLGMAYGDIDDEKFISEYENAIAKFGGHKSNFKFLAYAVSRLHEFDLPFDLTWIGPARSSKSTGALDFIEMGYGFRGVNMYANLDGQPFYKRWVDERCIYDNEKGISAIKSSHADYNLFDEGFRTNDRRRSMTKKQIDMTGDTNFQASKRSVNLNLIQMYEDFDIRTKSKSQATIVNTGRGEGLLFCDSRIITIVRDVAFESFSDQPKMQRFAPFGIHMMKREPGYVCELKWKERGAYADDYGNIYNAKLDPFFACYLENKIANQDRMKQLDKQKSVKKAKAPSKVQEIIRLFKEGVGKMDIARQLNVAPSYIYSTLSAYA